MARGERRSLGEGRGGRCWEGARTLARPCQAQRVFHKPAMALNPAAALGLLPQAKALGHAAADRLAAFNRRSLDPLAARVYSYLSLAHEETGTLADVRSLLLGLHRTAVLRHDDLGQETLLNLLLRNYLHYNLYDQVGWWVGGVGERASCCREVGRGLQLVRDLLVCKLPALQLV